MRHFLHMPELVFYIGEACVVVKRVFDICKRHLFTFADQNVFGSFHMLTDQPKYLASRPANALPWRASSFAIS